MDKLGGDGGHIWVSIMADKRLKTLTGCEINYCHHSLFSLSWCLCILFDNVMCCRRKGGRPLCRGWRSVSRAHGFTEQVWGRGVQCCEENRCSGLQWSRNDPQTQELLQVKSAHLLPSASLCYFFHHGPKPVPYHCKSKLSVHYIVDQ